MDAQGLRGTLMRAVVRLSAPVFLAEVVGPLLERVGELWAAGRLRPAQEHVVSTAVRQVLDWLLSRYDAPADAPLLVAGTPSGELHEFGAMLAAVVAADAGWRVLYLGPSLPASEIAGAAARAGAAVVAVSVVDGEAEDVERAGRELEALRSMLPEGILLVTGGRRSSSVTPEGVTVVEDLEALREVLSAVVPTGGES
jgi:methylmalonyl-CoA mutase cobalamin-binding subunit